MQIPLDGGPKREAETLATTWPRFKARLVDDDRSDRTIGGYGDVFKRLSDDVKNRSLRDLAIDPTIMEREVERILRKNCDYSVMVLKARDLINEVGRTDGPGRLSKSTNALHTHTVRFTNSPRR